MQWQNKISTIIAWIYPKALLLLTTLFLCMVKIFFFTSLYYKIKTSGMSKIKLIEREVIEVVCRKNPISQDKIKQIIEILGLYSNLIIAKLGSRN